MHFGPTMYVNKVTFLAMTATLAAGAAGGYLYHNAHNVPEPTPVAPAAPTPPPAVARTEPTPPVDVTPPRPVCDDTTGAVSDCPVAVSSEDEGICKGGIFWAGKRCADFKAAFKPKVAAAAVDCLKGLKGADVCDQNRANLCGHEALMSACQESMPASYVDVTSQNQSSAPPLPEGASQLAVQCQNIVKGCPSNAPAATFADCMRTLSGMNDTGRGDALECMKMHCSDKGFVGCEAFVTPKTAFVQ
jgi:hypothetical protein